MLDGVVPSLRVTESCVTCPNTRGMPVIVPSSSIISILFRVYTPFDFSAFTAPDGFAISTDGRGRHSARSANK